MSVSAPVVPRKASLLRPVETSRIGALALAALTAFYFLFALGAYGLLNDNEGLYAEMAREIVRGGSLIVPHLNGVPYLEKPPLLTWLVAALYALFGASEWTSRVVPAVSGIALVAGTFAFTARAADRFTAWTAGLMIASCLASVMVMRTLMPDGLLVCLFSLSMYSFYLWHTRGRSTMLVLSYALLGLAIMAKGFLALALGGLTIVIFAATGPRRWRYADLLRPSALAALLAIAAPWHLLLAWRNPDFAWFYVYHEHVLRFLGLRTPQDYYTGPFYYYLPRIVVGLFPWSAFLPLLLVRRTPADVARADLERFLWIWFWVALVFFSTSRDKGNYYMLIGTPAIAILLAGRIAAFVRADRRAALLAPTVVLAAAGTAAFLIFASSAWMSHPDDRWIATLRLHDSLLWSTAGFAAIAALAGILIATGRGRDALLALALASVPLLLCLAVAAQRAAPYSSERALASYLRARDSGDPVFLFEDYERLSSLPFYLRSKVPIVDSRSEDLLFGARYAPRGPFLSAAQFAADCRRGRALLLVDRLRTRDFDAKLGGLHLHPIARFGNVTVYENRTGSGSPLVRDGPTRGRASDRGSCARPRAEPSSSTRAGSPRSCRR